jgi:gliding motility-associated-like protein
MRILSFTLLFTLLFLKTSAQIEIQESAAGMYSPENLIYNYFKGEGVKILNVQYDGPAMSVGYFDKGKNVFGIDKGIVMTTGRVKTISNGATMLYGVDAIGKEQADNNNGSTFTDADAVALSPKEAPQNLVKYTITFQPSSDTLRFKYVFASEEYPEYACREYNDLFGFFISGPGIQGTFQNNGINIAKIPNTNKSVTINNIHPEYKLNNCPPAFADMYHANYDLQPVFDGFLDVFTAEVPVVPCATYTIKLVIADVGDKRLDSGVFLEAKSFGTNALKVETANAVAVEGCSTAKVLFKLSQAKNTDYVIPLKIIGGSAQASDYKPLSSAITIEKGQLLATLNLEAIKDQLKEDFESIGIEYTINSCRKDTIWLYVKDNNLPNPDLGSDKNICEGNEVILDATIAKENPTEKSFSNPLVFDINNIGNGSTLEPTLSEIKVEGVVPSLLGKGAIASVCVNIQHDRNEDIDLFLIAPNGKYIELSTDNGAKGKNYSNTCFSATSASPINTALPPFTGTFQAEGNWEDLYREGENPINGIWKLQVIDDQVGMKGKLLNWTINFKPSYDLKYEWSPKNNLSCADCAIPKAKPNQTTDYKVVITDTYQCKVSDSIKIIVSNEIPAPIVSCQTVSHNSITFVWQPVGNGTHNYEISINGNAWITPKNAYSHTVENLGFSETVYIQVRAKGVSNCGGGGAKIGSAECKTLNCLAPTLNISSQTSETCFGKKDASITLTSNAQQPIYKIDNQLNNSGVFKNLEAGKYRANVTDLKGCVTSIEVEIKSPSAIAVAASIKDVSCAGKKDATITLAVSGGISPYTFVWDNGQKENMAKDLAAGYYGVIIYDKNNCSYKNQYLVKELANMTLHGEVTPVYCYGEASGSVKLSVEGGSPPLSFKWSNQSTDQNLTKVKSGAYKVLVTDASGCLAEQQFNISAPESPMYISLNHSNTLCFGEKGYVSTFVTGGTAPIFYKWNSGETLSELKNIIAGEYKVTVTDAKGCTKRDSVKIVGLEEIKIQCQKTSASCFNGKDGQLNINRTFNGLVETPVAEMLFRWSNGNTSAENSNLSGGEKYSVTVTNRLGCSTTQTYQVEQPREMEVNTTFLKDAKCFDSEDGEIVVEAAGGNVPYFYEWDSAARSQIGNNAKGLKAGTYNVKVRDAKGCETTKSIVMKSPNKLKISYTPTNIACKDGNNGKLETFIVGGISPYQYQWNNGEKIASLNNLKAGEYSLTVTDKNQCMTFQNMKLQEPEALKAVIETTGATCAGARDGKIRIFAQGGTAPYKYSIDNHLFNGVANIVGLKSNYYSIAVKDLRGCVFTENDVFIDEPTPLKIDLGEDITIKYGDTTTLKLENYYTRNQAFKYSWKTDYNKFMSCTECPAPQVYPTNTATYWLKVTDHEGCTATDDIVIRVNYAPVIEVPTGFSPNNDGNNDMLMVHGESNIKVLYFNVYGRDGSLLFSEENAYVNDTKLSWDGTSRGTKLPSDTYIWGMEVEYANGQRETLKGNVTLIR